MKTLNFYYDTPTSYEVKNELDQIANMTTSEICQKYTLAPEDVVKFIASMQEDYETLSAEESEGYINDRNEEYAQLYNFL